MPLPCLVGPGSRFYGASGGGGSGTDFSQILWSDLFQDGTVGNTLSGNGYNTTHAQYSTVRTGPTGLPKVLEDTATSGATENAIGYYKDLGISLTAGDEIWIQVDWFMPVGSNFDASTYALKFLRAHVETAGLSHVGYDDLYLAPSGSENAWLHQSEIFGDNDRFGGGTTFPAYGVWNKVEFYVRLGHAPTSTGGLGRMRTWLNDVFLHETDFMETLNAATDIVRQILVVTYWNGGVPVTQTWSWGSIAIAAKAAGVRDDTAHMSTDSGGRIYLGPR